MGRFTQPDTIVPNPSDPQSFNRYSYCDGNPINYTDPTGHWKFKEWIGHIVGGVMGVAATIFSGGNLLVGMQVYSFVSSGINSAISGDFGAFAVGTAASFALGPLAHGIGLSMANALGSAAQTFIGGAIIGAAEFGAGGFISGFASEYARTGSGSDALRGAAWGAAFGAGFGAIAEGSYMAGWQNSVHGVSKEDLNKIRFNQVKRDSYGSNLSAKGEASYTAMEYSCETTMTEAKISLDKARLMGKVGLGKLGKGGITGIYGEASFKVIEGSNTIKLFKAGDTQFSLYYDVGYGAGVKGGLTVDQKGGKLGGGVYLGPGGSFEVRFRKAE